jgi:twinkle protein
MTGDDGIAGLFLDLEDVNLDDYGVIRHELKGPSSYTTELMNWFESDPLEKGMYFPWKSSHPLRFRPGELSVIAGPSFSGKSALITSAMVNWLRDKKFSDKKEKFLLISPEFSPRMNLARIIQQITARMPGDISGANVIAACTWLEGKLLIYDTVGQQQIDDIVNLIHYASQEHGITGIILDNLTVLQLPEGHDKNSAQSTLITKLVEACRTTNCHLFVVAHTRKPAKGEKLDQHSVRGAGEIVDLCDNLCLVERNREKEEKLANDFMDEEKRLEWLCKADTKLHTVKQRHGTAWTGTSKLFFDPFSMRWAENPKAPFLPFEEVSDIENLLEERNSRGYQKF